VASRSAGTFEEVDRSLTMPGVLDSNLARGPPDDRKILVTDQLSSTLGETDSVGGVIGERRYTLYGEVREGDAPDGVGFHGARIQEEAGLYYLRNRWYDARLGRFISRDPIGFSGGGNLYQAFSSVPISSRDPMGLLDPVTAAGWTARILVFGGTSLLGGAVLVGGTYLAYRIYAGATSYAVKRTIHEGLNTATNQNQPFALEPGEFMGSTHEPAMIGMGLALYVEVGAGMGQAMQSASQCPSMLAGEEGRLVAIDADATLKWHETSKLLRPTDTLVVTPNVVWELENSVGVVNIDAFLGARGIFRTSNPVGASIPATQLHSRLNMIRPHIGNAGDALNFGEAGAIGAETFITGDKKAVQSLIGGTGDLLLPNSNGTRIFIQLLP